MMENWAKTIHSDGSEEFVTPAFAKLGDEVTFRMRAAKVCPIRKVVFRTTTNGHEHAAEMKKERDVGHLTYYSVSLKVWNNPMHYRFKIFLQDEVWYLNAQGLFRHVPSDKDDFRFAPGFRPPSWLWDRVFYQIYPDRFFDGNPATNVKTGEYEYQGHKTIARKWGEPPGDYSTSFNLDFFGGDLAGVRQKISYLERLGVNGVWLNPIFLSPSNHKYDTQDYNAIDPHFGSDEDLVGLGKDLHKKGMRIILDGVFNHTGSCHKWFNRDGFYKEKGAYQDAKSPLAEHYIRQGKDGYH